MITTRLPSHPVSICIGLYIGVAVVRPCVLGVFCVASRTALDRRVHSCTTGVPLIILTFRTLHQPHFLSELCFPGRQNCNRAALHTALLRTSRTHQ